nr:YeeE/YedE thiosulfate transporter family protein [Comamonas serinivorans]
MAGIATVAFLRVAPLGVTAELGSWGRTGAHAAGLLPDTLQGLDSFRGCITAVKNGLWTRNGAFIAALVLGSFAAAAGSGSFRLQWPTRHEVWRNLLGGLLMGWGAMLALGCTVGTLLSGIMAAAVSGWVFAVACGVGLWLGWRLRQRLPG